MDKPSIEEVLHVLDTLYRSESTKDKEKASSWLTKLHSSVSCRRSGFHISAHHNYFLGVCMGDSRSVASPQKGSGDKLLCSSDNAK